MRRCMLFLVVIFVPSIGYTQEPYAPPAKVKAGFLKLLDRPKVPLDVKIASSKTIGAGMVLETLRFSSEKNQRVPTIVLRPEKVKARMPAVIVLHGTGGNMNGQLGVMKELVKRNIIAVAIDARYHGQRAKGAKGSAAYNQAIAKAWRTKPGQPMEHPFYYDTVWDLMRLVDYLETRDDIDAKRIGMIGFSMGGIQTYMAASVDDRIKVSVPAIAIQSFRWSLDNDKWQGRANTIKLAHQVAAKDLGEKEVNQQVCRALWNKIVPGITGDYDCPSLIRLCAGRPMLILSGTKDKNCPYEGAKLAIASAERAYKDAGASDKLRVIVEEVGHTVTAKQRAAAVDWFVKWLK
jgi:alpha-beta hydrolase superfamily lysophospholipase